MEDKKFTNNPRMTVNSLYLLFGQSKESNARILPCFGCSMKAIQWFLQKYYIWFLGKDQRKCLLYQMIGTRLTGYLWHKYVIHVFPLSHHNRYVGYNLLHGLFVSFISLILFSLAHLSLIMPLSSFCQLGLVCKDSQIATWPRYRILFFTNGGISSLQHVEYNL